MPTPGPWIQPDDIYVNLSEGTNKTTTGHSSYRGVSWEGATANDHAYYEAAYEFTSGADPLAYPDVLSWLPDYSGGDDSLGGGASSWHRGHWGNLDLGGDYDASIRAQVSWFNVECTIPAGKPANPTPGEIPDGATVEWEAPSGEYTGEVRYSALAWASHSSLPDGWDVNESGSGRLMVRAGVGPGATWLGIDGMMALGWNTSAPVTEQTTLEFLLPSLAACVMGLPSQIYDGTPIPDASTPGLPPTREDFYVGVPVAAPGATPVVGAAARYVPPRYRFVYESPEVAGGGLWTTRQRQTATGNTGGWPLRQRNNGGATGAWSLRQRQTGN